MHEVLAQTAHRSDLSRAVRGHAYRRHIPKAEAEALLHSLESAFDAPEIKEHVQRWFTGFNRVFTERTLSDAAGARRPDRVVFLADGSVEVVDYKFGTLTRDESGCAVTEPSTAVSSSATAPVSSRRAMRELEPSSGILLKKKSLK